MKCVESYYVTRLSVFMEVMVKGLGGEINQEPSDAGVKGLRI